MWALMKIFEDTKPKPVKVILVWLLCFYCWLWYDIYPQASNIICTLWITTKIDISKIASELVNLWNSFSGPVCFFVSYMLCFMFFIFTFSNLFYKAFFDSFLKTICNLYIKQLTTCNLYIKQLVNMNTCKNL